MTETTLSRALASRLRICGQRALLPPHLVSAALSFGPGTEIADVQQSLRCSLEEHITGDHHAFVKHLDGPDTGSVWARWSCGQLAGTVVVLPDCRAASAGLEPCSEFADHPGSHTYDIHDPWVMQ
ncbi:hypothetical protein [Actinacidiphila paucisporea]|uniref:hypothetical protein n=1 Tax=Actinacidiphila paucisporea TaxID=310782 RepID=UPI0009361D3D|nr:hypothetical protein [Actinacidiphila paucisporea]